MNADDNADTALFDEMRQGAAMRRRLDERIEQVELECAVASPSSELRKALACVLSELKYARDGKW